MVFVPALYDIFVTLPVTVETFVLILSICGWIGPVSEEVFVTSVSNPALLKLLRVPVKERVAVVVVPEIMVCGLVNVMFVVLVWSADNWVCAGDVNPTVFAKILATCAFVY